ncbi:MAG: hypothetical protein K2H49_06760, partial [Muribaculaceae bacterium]|nr:hypothetical protein [Muribaculaceae bacterium]
MRTGVGKTVVADPGQQGVGDEALPEIVATNLPKGDTLIGLKPLARRDINVLPDSSVADVNDTDTLSVGIIATDSLENDTITEEISDRAAIITDSIGDDRDDLTRINREKVDIETAVAFSAKDSVVLLGNNLAYLFGEGKVEYGQFKLDADEIKMVMDSTTVYATGRVDSLGELIGKPVFQDGGDIYESKSMSFNFKNQRGFITVIVTEQGEGYLTGGRAKKMEDGSFFAEDAIYTTCDEHEHPHFYFQLTRGKIRPGKDVVSGPVYMVVADIPLPLALPFGYFPFSKEYSSGIIFPTFGDDYNRGFYMRNGGYYFAFSDYVDLAVTGEIYTKGSWGISGRSSYRKRYKYSGSFNISFLNTVTGDKGLPDYAKQNNFQVVWSHSMDQKSNPNLSFSASVNFSTSGYTRNDLNSYYSNSFTENTKSSTVNM